MDRSFNANRKSLGRIKRASGDEHSCQTHQRMEESHQLRHSRHLHGAGAPGTNATTNANARYDKCPRGEASGQAVEQCGANRNRHSNHAIEITLA